MYGRTVPLAHRRTNCLIHVCYNLCELWFVAEATWKCDDMQHCTDRHTHNCMKLISVHVYPCVGMESQHSKMVYQIANEIQREYERRKRGRTMAEWDGDGEWINVCICIFNYQIIHGKVNGSWSNDRLKHFATTPPRAIVLLTVAWLAHTARGKPWSTN